MMVQKNEIVEITITDITQEGSGVGHLDGMAVFVPLSAVGDRLSVRLVKVNKTHCYGKIEQVITPSPDRIKPDCPVFRRCGGCALRHVAYEAELRYKENFVQQNLRRIGKIGLQVEPILPSPLEQGYRNKAQFPVRMQKNGLCAGFFAPRTHEVIDCHNCRLQPPSFAAILETVLLFMKEFEISSYDESTGEGLVRHLYLRRGQYSGETMVCLVINGDRIPYAQELVGMLLACDDSIVSVVTNIQKKNTNVILGDQTRVIYGKASIRDQLCGVWFEISPQAFYQVNSLGAEALYRLVAEYAALTGNETVLDLYCGAGTIGLSLARSCKRVVGVEIVPQAVENARRNAQENGIANAKFSCMDAGQAAAQIVEQGDYPDVVILDPPRKGCGRPVLEAVAKMRPQRVVMVSCNSASLARDCADLSELGYRVARCRPVDMFPRTVHVEAVVLLYREDA